MIASTRLYLLRHAEVEARYQRVFGGQIDMDLSSRGHDQAAALAKFLRAKKFDAIYASPMKRVQQTLAPVAQGRESTPILLPGLREVHFGDWTGLSWDEVRTRFNISPFQWLDQLEQAAIPNAENSQTFRDRVEPCVQQILRDHPSQEIAVVCHGGTIRMILAILLKLPLGKMASFEIEYASLTQVHHMPHKTEVHLLNFTPWRDIP